MNMQTHVKIQMQYVNIPTHVKMHRKDGRA